MNTLLAGTRRTRLVSRGALALAMAIAASSAVVAVAPAQAGVDIGISVNFAPPALPVYEQPMIPGPGYIWTPGYWAWDAEDGYFWVPGTWVRPPYYGAMWTPGYWGWRNGLYVFYRGYWGRTVGYYGGINYGYGYGGIGYEGGYWRGNNFYYNRAANNVNIHITNVYQRTVINNVTVNRYSFNGPGGATVRPTAAQIAYQNQRHTAPVADQIRQRDAARADRSMRASFNKGNPAVGATERPGIIARPSGLQEKANAARDGRPAAGPAVRDLQGRANGEAGRNPGQSQSSNPRHPQRPTMDRGQSQEQPQMRQQPLRQGRMQPRADRPLPMTEPQYRGDGQRQGPRPRDRSADMGQPQMRQQPMPQGRMQPQMRQQPMPQGRMQPRVDRPMPMVQPQGRGDSERQGPRPHERGPKDEHGGH